MKIAAVTPTSFIDYPGSIAFVLYTQGCNLNCNYCHNPSFIAKGNGRLPWETVFAAISKRRMFIDAVVFSGGEPTIQKTLPARMKQIKEETNLLIGLHTNGLGKAFKEAAKLCDYILLSHPTIKTQQIAKRAKLVKYSKVINNQNIITTAWSK